MGSSMSKPRPEVKRYIISRPVVNDWIGRDIVLATDYDRDVGERDRTIGDLVARSQQDYERITELEAAFDNAVDPLLNDRITHLQQHIEGLTKANRALHDEVKWLTKERGK